MASVASSSFVNFSVIWVFILLVVVFYFPFFFSFLSQSLEGLLHAWSCDLYVLVFQCVCGGGKTSKHRLQPRYRDHALMSR